jgi:threonine dehydratase
MCLGSLTWPVVRDMVDAVMTVSEEEIIAATKLVWTRLKIAVEPSAGVGVALVMSERFKADERFAGLRNVGVVLCGGNVDVDNLPWK